MVSAADKLVRTPMKPCISKGAAHLTPVKYTRLYATSI